MLISPVPLAGIAGLVAIVQHDRGDKGDAFRWFATAEKAAHESGDRRMTAWVLARHAMVPLNYGAPEAAVRIASRARRAAGRTPTAGRRAGGGGHGPLPGRHR